VSLSCHIQPHFQRPPPPLAVAPTFSVNIRPTLRACMSEIRNIFRPMHDAQWPQIPRSKRQSILSPNASPSKWGAPSTRLGKRVNHLSSNAKPASPSARRPPRCACSVCVIAALVPCCPALPPVLPSLRGCRSRSPPEVRRGRRFALFFTSRAVKCKLQDSL
jgi:hypothetical protein